MNANKVALEDLLAAMDELILGTESALERAERLLSRAREAREVAASAVAELEGD